MPDGKNQRKERRLKADELPEALRTFTLLANGESEITARTVDASPKGFGFVVEGDSEDFVVGCRITLYPLGKDKPLHGRIIHAGTTFIGYRVGVEMLETPRYENWRDIINAIMETAPARAPEPGPEDLILGED